ncbi:MAG: hypothetical protein IJ300_04850 [Clostridia bacterium]|nr:hypothetical protein [Clostridia bacterium]
MLRTYVLEIFDRYRISPSPSSAPGSGSDKSQRATNCSTPRYLALSESYYIVA